MGLASQGSVLNAMKEGVGQAQDWHLASTQSPGFQTDLWGRGTVSHGDKSSLQTRQVESRSGDSNQGQTLPSDQQAGPR